jgi:large subunit ribosomal protein L6
MSRIGKKPIGLPKEATAIIEDSVISVEGPRGKLSHQIPEGVTIEITDDSILITRNSDERRDRSLHGLTRTLVANMVKGVTQGFTKELEIVGVGFRAEKKDKTLSLLLGFSHPIKFVEPDGVQIQVNKQIIRIEGIDKCLVGQTASKVRSFKKPDVYKGKGIRYVGEVVRRKVGKTGAK